jgi:hypothetical protein
VIAQINVPASGGGAPTATWVAPYAVAAGGITPVRTLPSPVWGNPDAPELVFYAGVIYRGNGTDWAPTNPLPAYVRVRTIAAKTHSANTFTGNTVPLAATADAQGTVFYTLASDQVAINQGGLYHVSANIYGGLANFAVQIRNATTGAILAGNYAAGNVGGADAIYRLPAGAVLDVRVNPPSAMNTPIDAVATPCYLSILRVSD